jgi:hypothetical protein
VGISLHDFHVKVTESFGSEMSQSDFVKMIEGSDEISPVKGLHYNESELDTFVIQHSEKIFNPTLDGIYDLLFEIETDIENRVFNTFVPDCPLDFSYIEDEGNVYSFLMSAPIDVLCKGVSEVQKSLTTHNNKLKKEISASIENRVLSPRLIELGFSEDLLLIKDDVASFFKEKNKEIKEFCTTAIAVYQKIQLAQSQTNHVEIGERKKLDI